MKIRTGFVTNSSSSSYIVAFDKMPEDIGELKRMLFGLEETYEDPFNYGVFNAYTVTGIVFNDLINGKPLTKDEMIEEMSSGHFNGMPDYKHIWNLKGEEYKKAWDKYDKEVEETAKEYVERFIEENSFCVFYKFKYSDNDGELDSAMEHGDLFDNINHLKISHH